MRCSARSFGSASSSAASAASSSGVVAARPGAGDRDAASRGRPSTLTSASGLEPTTSKPSKRQQVHVRAGVGGAQHAVDVERVARAVEVANRWETTTWNTSPARIASLARLDRRPRTPPRCVPALAASRLGWSASRTRRRCCRPARRGRRVMRVEPGDRVGAAPLDPLVGGVVVDARWRRAADEPSSWSSTARSVASIIASSGTPRSSGASSGSRSQRRTTS